MHRSARSIALAVVVTASLAGSAFAAGALTTTVPTLTGCLANRDSVLIKVKLGDQPASPCSSGQTLVRISGGDITSITVGEGLTGGGTNGAITIGLDASFTLPQGCVAGDIVEKTATGWTCGDDDDTKYAAGTGLDLSAGNVFSLEADNVVVNGESCEAGKYVSGIGSDGHVNCAALPAAGSVKAYVAKTTTVPPLAGTMTILTLNLPAGTYVLGAVVNYVNMDSDTGSSIDCWLPNSWVSTGAPDPREQSSLSLQSWVTTSGGTVALTCHEHSADVEVGSAMLQAIKVDTLN